MKNTVVILCTFLAAVAFADDGIKNESELGIVQSSGNSKVQTFNVKQVTSYEFSKNILKGNAGYLRSKSGGVESANAWNLGLRYERALSETMSIYLGESINGDKFQKILQRYNTDLGGKYEIIKSETTAWFTEAGYRYTSENRAGGVKRSFNYLRAYTEVEKKWSPTVSTKYWLEYLPNLTESEDYQVNTELSLSAALSSVFSVKTAYLVKFDGKPASGVVYKSDRLFTTALVAKF